MSKDFSRKYSEVRTELLGIAAILILIGHSHYYIDYPGFLGRIVIMGGIGVCIFIFISGMGLYRSLDNARDNNAGIKKFYIKRIKKVIIPYLFIAGIWYFFRWIVFENNIPYFFYELSTASFWVNHKGAWYVAMLIPLYIVYPLYFKWVEKGARGIKTIIIIALWILLGIFLSLTNAKLYDHLSNIIRSYVIFAIGNYLGEKMKNNSFPDIKITIICALVISFRVCLKFFVKIPIIELLSTAAIGILVVIFLTYILYYTKKIIFINRVFGFFGVMSLELYLTNIFLGQIYDYFSLNISNGFVTYGFIVILGIILSILIHWLINKGLNSFSLEKEKKKHGTE